MVRAQLPYATYTGRGGSLELYYRGPFIDTRYQVHANFSQDCCLHILFHPRYTHVNMIGEALVVGQTQTLVRCSRGVWNPRGPTYTACSYCTCRTGDKAAAETSRARIRAKALSAITRVPSVHRTPCGCLRSSRRKGRLLRYF